MRRRIVHRNITAPIVEPVIPELPITEFSIADYNTLQFVDSSKLYKSIYHYNACIVQTPNEFRMFFRISNHPKMHLDRIATCLFDKDFKIIEGSNQLIKNHSDSTKYKSCLFTFSNGEHTEDPRAIFFNNHFFLFYTDGWTIGIAKLDINCKTIYSHYLEKPDSIIKAGDTREKNWIPFVDNNQLFCLYSDNPRIIFKLKDLKSSLVIEAVNKTDLTIKCLFGNIRGGCPPLLFENNKYIWFFHTYHNLKYYIGAYMTEGFSKPIAIIENPILIGQKQPPFKSKALIIKDCVVYPCGAVWFCGNIRISMGINDYKIAFLDIIPTDLNFILL